MPKLIKDGQITTDSFSIKRSQEESTPVGDVLVSLDDWLANRETYLAQATQVGVWLDSHEEPAALAQDVNKLDVIAINFPVFGDGRGYSAARLLRERFGFKGELRAIGDILRDQLFNLNRCGFNAYSLREDRDEQDALESFDDFSCNYQTSVDQTEPLFQRR